LRSLIGDILREMKQETNNEMDLLLRKLGRAVNSVPQNSGNGADESSTEVHLDADELNAYAENALPAATRAHYTAHLADCTRCRHIVSQLTLAAGLIIIEEQQLSTPTAFGFKAFLSSLFSPMVLRYAVPALGLVIVASIGFFVFRDSGSKQVAENLQQRPAVSEEQKGASPASHFEDSRAPNQAKSSGVVVAKTEVAESKPEINEQSKVAADSRREAKEEEARQQPTTTIDRLEAAPAKAPSSTAAAASPKAISEDQKQSGSDVAQTKAQPASEVQGDLAKSNEKGRAKLPAKEPSTVIGGFSSGIKKSKSDSADKRGDVAGQETVSRERGLNDKDEAETTSISGHRFRKQGAIWIDVAYKSSHDTVNVTRGSEQYRALVADEPGIRTIAEQLRGEVIVVWKGRAYRIR
jgi:hypothetical protein